MIASLPEALKQGPNQGALTYLNGRSAHSDIAIPLCQTVKELPNAHLYCSDTQNFRYVLAFTHGVVFGFAEGMEGVTLRLPPALVEQLIAQGAERRPAIGPEWVFLRLFGDRGFRAQLDALADAAFRTTL